MVTWRSRATRVVALPLCSKHHGDVARKRMLQAYVASVCFNCFRCFRGMLQVFRMDVAKVDRNGAYTAMAIQACCKSLFQMFRLFLRHILQVFYLDVAYACNDFQVFSGVLQVF